MGTRGAVLCVDDEEAFLELLADYLSDLDWTPLCAGTIDEALVLFGKNKANIRLAIVDYHLPGSKTGLDLCQLLVADGFEGNCVVATGWANEDLTHSEGIVQILRKPFEFKELERILDDL